MHTTPPFVNGHTVVPGAQRPPLQQMGTLIIFVSSF